MLHNWKVGKVIPVPKMGRPSSGHAYHPVSLTSVCSGLMEHVIYCHIVKFLTSARIFHPNQHGFQKELSCEMQFTLFTNISSCLDVNLPVDALFLDFEKAFDKVPHQRLFLKLPCLNLDQQVDHWIHSFLNNCMQFIYANSFSSRLSPVTSSVPY